MTQTRLPERNSIAFNSVNNSQPSVIAEVAKLQMGKMHTKKTGTRTARPRVLSQLNCHDCRGFDDGSHLDYSAGVLFNGTAR